MSATGTAPGPSARSESRTAEDRYRAIFQASPHGMVILDDTGTILEINEQFAVMTGHPPVDLPGQKVLQTLDPAAWEEANQSFIKAQFAGQSFVETTVRRKDGSTFPAELTWKRLMLDGQMRFHATLSDASDRQRALEESRIAREEAEHANEARLLFLATMSHEIRTPLNGIIGFSHLLSESELPEHEKQYVNMVRRSSDLLLRIIDDILNISRIESGSFDLEDIDFDPRTCIEEVFELHANAEKIATVELLHAVSSDVPQLLRGDAARIRQILINLVSNALKFTTQGHILVRCIVQENRYLAFSVRDTGVGFDPAKTDSLFLPFFQEDASTTRKYGGTGLGLSICRKLVERMGGYISARSNPGQGAEFWFGIPLVTSPTPTPAPSLPLRGGRAFLAGGSDCGSEVLRYHLSQTGLQVDSQQDVQSAVAHLKNNSYDLILFDPRTTNCDPAAFAHHVLRTKANQESKLVLLSTHLSPEHHVRYRADGYAGLLIAPFRRADLIASLTSTCSSAPTAPPSPTAPAQPAPAATAPPSSRPAPERARPLLLIAEDHEINAQLATLMARRLGFEAHVAENGRKAIDLLATGQKYSAILMDMRMPEMDGLEATRRIRFGQVGVPVSQIPIYALTANAMSSDRDACLQAGMNGYFAKPLRVDEVERTFREAGLLPA